MQKLAEIQVFLVDDWTKEIPSHCLVDRDEELLRRCQNKAVLHIGAADAPFEMDKGRSGQLLHQKIQRVASRVVGVDVDQSAVNSLKELGINDIICANICTDTVLPGEIFDVVLCCDVIEHVSAPGALLAACSRFMGNESELIVTTINATALKPALRALGGRESVHSDHVAYYSFATLGKILTTANLRPVEYGVFSYPTVNPIVGLVSRLLMRAAPGSADGIIMSARRG